MQLWRGWGSRGRSGTRSAPYMATLAALQSALCAVQTFHEESRAFGSRTMSLSQASKLAGLVGQVERSADLVRAFA